MTKNTKKDPKTTKKGSRRSKMKHPELNKKMNIKARQDYMDTSYINGVRDEKGKRVMRPLTEEERAWLAQFYKEWLNADSRDSKLYTSKEDWRAIYSENNARNRCLFNQTKKTGKLTKFGKDMGDRNLIKELGEYDLELLLIHDRDWFKKENDD